MVKFLIALFVLIALIIGGFYYISYSQKNRQATSKDLSQIQKQQVSSPSSQKVKNAETPVLDTSDSSIDGDITALDKDLSDLSSSEKSFGNEGQGL